MHTAGSIRCCLTGAVMVSSFLLRCRPRESGDPVTTGHYRRALLFPNRTACVYWVPSFSGTTAERLRDLHIFEVAGLVIDADLGRGDPRGELSGLGDRLHQVF